MIRNVLGKAVTKSTLMRLPEYDGESEISVSDMARVALALKNSQGKEKDEEEARGYVDRLRDQWARNETRLTLGWIYNASGCAITLVDSHDWEGGLASLSLYPVRIENGQWGAFLHKQPSYETEYESESAGAVLYEAFHSNYDSTSYWCVAWNNQPTGSFSNQAGPVVHAWINKSKVYWDEFVSKMLGNHLISLIHHIVSNKKDFVQLSHQALAFMLSLKHFSPWNISEYLFFF